MSVRKVVLYAVVGLVVLYLGGYVGMWQWGICRKWCEPGQSLLINVKTGAPAEKDSYAKKDQQGIREQMLGPGRHFGLDPWNYDVRLVKDVIVKPGQILLLKNNLGKDIPPDRFIAEPDEKGIQRFVGGTGVYRINTFGQEPIVESAKIIKPGHVGVQTMRSGEKKGVLDSVLQAGYYNINPQEIRVDDVEIGYRALDIHTENETVEVAGEGGVRKEVHVKEGSGVSFPLADGKQMHLDFTVVWGIRPQDAPRIIKDYGTVDMVEDKIIIPQVMSICKNCGSNLTTQNFIEGERREKFQEDVTEKLHELGKEKGIHFLIALVRGFHPAEDIKQTIQGRRLAEEEKNTLAIEQKRDSMAAELEQAKRQVDVAITDFDAETEALVQEELEKGRKRAAETKAEADRKVAELQKQAADINAQSIRIRGQAEADVIQAKKSADATRLQMMVAAYGGAEHYNLATFAERLPAHIEMEYRYAGPGTFWTDATQGLTELAAKRILEKEEAASKAHEKESDAKKPDKQQPAKAEPQQKPPEKQE